VFLKNKICKGGHYVFMRHGGRIMGCNVPFNYIFKIYPCLYL
jgi:hypothetical protein